MYRFVTSYPVWLQNKDGKFANDTCKVIAAMVELGGVCTDHDLRDRLESITGERWEKGRLSARRNPLVKPEGYKGLRVESRGKINQNGNECTLWRLIEVTKEPLQQANLFQ